MMQLEHFTTDFQLAKFAIGFVRVSPSLFPREFLRGLELTTIDHGVVSNRQLVSVEAGRAVFMSNYTDSR